MTVTVSELLDDVVVQIVVCPTVVMVAFTGIEEFIIVVISVMLLENLVVWIMLGSEDGGVVVGWSDGVVTRSCKVVPVAWVVFEVFVLVVMGKVISIVGTVTWAVVVVEVFTVVVFVLATEVLSVVAKSVVTVVVTLVF